MAKPKRYTEDLTRGFVVRFLAESSSGVPVSSWWYGPDHGWGTTSGPLDYSVAVFPSAIAATRAIAGRPRYSVQTIAEARGTATRQAERAAARAAE